MTGDLIPGLPEEVARECLIRVPYDSFSTVRYVCKHWRDEVQSPNFHRLRRSTGVSRAVIAMVQAEPSSTSAAATKHAASPSTPLYRLVLHEPGSGKWSPVPPVPGLPHGLPLFCHVASAGREVVIVGGWDRETWAATDGVHIYDFLAARWRRGSPMPGTRRSFFACAASEDGRTVCVAGGHDEEKNALRSALAYDVARDQWMPLPDMARERDECSGVFLRGKFHVIGGYSTDSQGQFGKSAEAFDVSTWKWDPVDENKLEPSTCPKTCVAGADGRIYMCRGGQVAVLDGEAWRVVAEVPEDARVGEQLVAMAEGLVVMGSSSYGGAQVEYLLSVREKKAAAWRRWEVPSEYSGHVQAASCIEI